MNIYKTSQPQNLRDNSFLKASVLLTIGFFLISAPTPDPGAIADLISNLIVLAKNPAL